MNFSDNYLARPFQRCHFDSSIILVCIRLDITDKLSYWARVARMAARNVEVAPTTIMRWVQRV